MSQTPNTAIAVIGIDIGKNSFHVMGHDARGNARPVHTDVPIPEDRWLSLASFRAPALRRESIGATCRALFEQQRDRRFHVWCRTRR